MNAKEFNEFLETQIDEKDIWGYKKYVSKFLYEIIDTGNKEPFNLLGHNVQYLGSERSKVSFRDWDGDRRIKFYFKIDDKTFKISSHQDSWEDNFGDYMSVGEVKLVEKLVKVYEEC